MKKSLFSFSTPIKLLLLLGMVWWTESAFSQIPPPGYERALKMQREQMNNLAVLDQDSVTVVDTVEVFDPEKNESETQIIVTRYSMHDYCKDLLHINNPEMLLDHQPHTILDPTDYENMTIILRESGKLDTIPKKN